MALIYKEASFPSDYREEVRQIMGAVYKLRSIAITGLAGMEWRGNTCAGGAWAPSSGAGSC